MGHRQSDCSGIFASHRRTRAAKARNCTIGGLTHPSRRRMRPTASRHSMSGPLLTSAQFFTTVAQLQQLPATGLPEVAFVGRSNAGKSSAINKLCNRNRLAFASRPPGRTQALNYFSLGPPGGDFVAYLVDTPGYGYAAAPGEVRKQWNTLAGRYLGERAQLRGVVLMVDIRRLVGERDVDLLRWIAPDAPILVLLTKADKLARTHQRRAMDE